MAFIKVESEDGAFIKEESEDMKIEEVFSVKQEETEEQTDLMALKEESEELNEMEKKDQRPFSCQQCGKTFKRKTYLRPTLGVYKEVRWQHADMSSLRSRDSGVPSGTAEVAGRRNVSVPYSGNEGYIRNRDVPFRGHSELRRMTTNGVLSLITPPRLSSSALRKSELPVVRLARTKDSYLTQEYQGTLGSISQRKYAIMPSPKGGDLEYTYDPEGLHMEYHWGVQPQVECFNPRGGNVACRGKDTCSERLTVDTCSERLTVEIHMWGSPRGGTMHMEAPSQARKLPVA
ncbi:unnamed protein product [Leuciscus chuanchicus]